MRRLLLLAFLLVSPVAQAQLGMPAGMGQSFVATLSANCPQGTVFNDFCPTAPVAQTKFSAATVFAGYVTRPPFNVPCVDYACGLITPLGSLADPTTAALPTGCVRSGTTVTCSTAGIAISGYDFGLHNGTKLVCAAANLTVSNNHFLVGTNAGASGTAMSSTGGCSNLTMTNNDVDGNNVAVTSQAGQTLNFTSNGGGTWTLKYNYMHNPGGDMIDWGSSSPLVTLVFANFFKDIGVNTPHSDTIQFFNQKVAFGGRMSFNYVWQTVNQPGAGNGLFVQLSEGPTMTMASLDVSNNGAAALAACNTCNWAFGFYDDDSATSQFVSVRNNYADPTGINLFTQAPWFATGKIGDNLSHPFLAHDLTNMVTGVSIPINSQSSPGPQGYYMYPDASGYTPSLNDVFSITANPASGTLSAGQTVVFTVTLAALPWTVVGSPTLTLNCTPGPCLATYTGGSGTNVLTFSHTVQVGETATPLQVLSINPNATACTGAPIDASYKLALDEEFVGPTLDATKWTKGWFGTGITPPVNSFELACYDPAQVTVSGGLSLAAVTGSESCPGSKPYKSGIITSQPSTGPPPLQQFTFGYFEAKMTLPASGSSIANWPAWWLNSQNNPTTGEIDIMEGLSGQACSTFHNSGGQQQTCALGNFTGTHIFAAKWTASSIAWYYDNLLIGTASSGITSSPVYLVLNNAMSTPGDFGGPTVAPATVGVSWVHVYQQGISPVTPEPGYSGPGGCL